MTKKTEDQIAIFPETVDDRRAPRERGLLAALAFADPDKKNPRHDAACRYVAVNAAEVVGRCVITPNWNVVKVAPEQEKHLCNKRDFTIGFIDVLVRWTLGSVSKTCGSCLAESDGSTIVEVKIAKMPIGDAIRQLKLYRDSLRVREAQRPRAAHRDCAISLRVKKCADDWLASATSELDAKAAEAKAKAERASFAYAPSFSWEREHLKEEYEARIRPTKEEFTEPELHAMVLVTAYEISTHEASMLHEEGIVHIRLGERFEKWLSESKMAQSEEL